MLYHWNQGAPPFFNIDFPWLFHDQKMKIHDLSAQHIFPSKRYTTYDCTPELVVTVPSARSTIVKKIKRFIIWLYKWSRVTFIELLSAVVKMPRHYHHFPWLSMTFAIFHDFPGLANGLPKFHDFSWPGGGAPCKTQLSACTAIRLQSSTRTPRPKKTNCQARGSTWSAWARARHLVNIDCATPSECEWTWQLFSALKMASPDTVIINCGS